MTSTDTDSASGWIKAKQKSRQGTDWHGTVNVVVGRDDDAETVELHHRLLSADEALDHYAVISGIAGVNHDDGAEDLADEERRLRELQQSDDLSEDEEAELAELQREVAEASSGLLAELDTEQRKEVFSTFSEAGKQTIVPSSEDISQALEASPSEQRDRFGEVIQGGRDTARELVKEEMVETLEESPYPIAFLVGRAAWSESQEILGNALQ